MAAYSFGCIVLADRRQIATVFMALHKYFFFIFVCLEQKLRVQIYRYRILI